MKSITKIIILSVAIITLVSTFALARTFGHGPRDAGQGLGMGERPKMGRGMGFGMGDKANADPAKALENFKAMLAKKVANGKITQAQADQILADFQKNQQEMKAFKEMPLEQKKSTLIAKCKADLDKKVAAGKLIQADADKRLADATARINAWDGTSRPPMGMQQGIKGEFGQGRKGGMGQGKDKGTPPNFKGDPAKALESFKARLDKRVASGKITQAQADQTLADFQKKQQEKQAFKEMPLEQEKSTLIAKCKTNLDKKVANGKLTQADADKKLADATAKINAWDGTGRPPMGMEQGRKGGFGQKNHMGKGRMRNNPTMESQNPNQPLDTPEFEQQR